MIGTRSWRNARRRAPVRMKRKTAETRRVGASQGGELDSILVGGFMGKLQHRFEIEWFKVEEPGLEVAAQEAHTGDRWCRPEDSQNPGQNGSAYHPHYDP